jgi:hypothetical protein
MYPSILLEYAPCREKHHTTHVLPSLDLVTTVPTLASPCPSVQRTFVVANLKVIATHLLFPTPRRQESVVELTAQLSAFVALESENQLGTKVTHNMTSTPNNKYSPEPSPSTSLLTKHSCNHCTSYSSWFRLFKARDMVVDDQDGGHTRDKDKSLYSIHASTSPLHA